MRRAERLTAVYDRLFNAFGTQHWWPGETPFEVMAGAILTQSTNWKNVEKAILNLKGAGVFDPDTMLAVPSARLALLIKSSGYFNQKTKKLKNYLEFFKDKYNASVQKMKMEATATLREQLLGVKGIGKETADSILLYALEKPVFVVDAYTSRVLSRHNIISEDATYDELQELFMDNLPHDVKLFNEFHALFVKVGKGFCKKNPECDRCPLKGI
ncbi:MAG TPA: endonuclease III domain-containing protein [bacterium]